MDAIATENTCLHLDQLLGAVQESPEEFQSVVDRIPRLREIVESLGGPGELDCLGYLEKHIGSVSTADKPIRAMVSIRETILRGLARADCFGAEVDQEPE